MARVGTTRTTSTGKSKDIFEAEWPKRRGGGFALKCPDHCGRGPDGVRWYALDEHIGHVKRREVGADEMR